MLLSRFFRFPSGGERCFRSFFRFPPGGKHIFYRFLIFPPGGNAVFRNFQFLACERNVKIANKIIDNVYYTNC